MILLGAAAYLLFTRADPGAKFPTHYAIAGVCLACKQDAAVTHGSREIEPYPCPKCGQRAVYEWMYCPDCKKRFIPNLVRPVAGEPPRMPVVPACVLCKSAGTTSYDPRDTSQKPVGDVPLPKWGP